MYEKEFNLGIAFFKFYVKIVVLNFYCSESSLWEVRVIDLFILQEEKLTI